MVRRPSTVEYSTGIQFLDIKLALSEQHVCWAHHPKANRPLLPYDSSHSKLVKKGIVNLCFMSTLRSCYHAMRSSSTEQYERLLCAGFPKAVLVSVAEGVLKKLRRGVSTRSDALQKERQKVAVVPYMPRTAHNLKKIAKLLNTKVLLSAPEKLAKMCKLTDPFHKAPAGSLKKHRSPFVACAKGVVYQTPLLCGKKYVGQPGRCFNDRLREHNQRFRNGHL